MRLIASFVLLSASVMAQSQELTASCKNPEGRALGVLGQLGKNRPIDDTDSMKGGVVTLSWKLSQTKANIVTDTGAANSVSTTEGILIFRTEEQVSFVAVYPGAAYMYSIFPKARKMLISSHQLFLGMDSGSALGKTFFSTCEISVQ